MVNNEKLRRYGLDKLAFLVLLVLGLLSAWLIISSRSGFKLSGPISLKGTGLEVSVPASGNWQQLSNAFKYENNEFRFASLLQISGDSAITVQWRYFMLPLEKTASQQFKAKAAVIHGQVESEGKDKFGQFTFDYAKIDSNTVTLLCGTTALPDGRMLMLEVGQKGAGLDLANKIFEALLASVKYNPDSPIINGAELMKDFKTSFLLDLINSEQFGSGRANYYRIKDIRGGSIGFSTDSITYSTDVNDKRPLTSASLVFLSPAYNAFAEQATFYSDISLKNFDWTIKQGNLLTSRQQPGHIQLLESGILTIERSGKTEEIPFTENMIPDCMLDLVVAAFLKSDYDTVMLEVILSDGKISPMILSRIKSSETSVLPAESSAQAEFFGAYTVLQKLYFDGQDRLVSAEVQGSFSYRLERTTRAAIISEFPQWVEKIQQMEQYQTKKNRSKKPD